MDKVAFFCAQTGASQKDAKDFLHSHKGPVKEAVKTYLLTARPHGPQKNVENHRPPNSATNNTRQTTLSPTPVTTGTANNAPSAKNAGSGNKAGSEPPLSPNTMQRKYLKRGLSKTTDNIDLVTKAREHVQHDMIAEDQEDTDGTDNSSGPMAHFVETPEYTFILPDLSTHPDDFRAFLHKELIETSTLVSLEQAGRLNWWADMCVCQRLLPLATSGDGNCLLHAASLGMWGFHDRLLTLRSALYTTLTHGPERGSFWRRWRWHQTQANKQSGLILSEAEWGEEWKNCLKLASTKPRSTPGSRDSCCDSHVTKGLMERGVEKEEESTEVFYESLEEFHVFVLAHVLRRPIIVVADTILKDTNGEALAPIPFGGIYLPLLVKPSLCHRSPLLLTYDAAHFSALVAMDTHDDQQALPAAIPLVAPDLELLPIHFLVDPGPEHKWDDTSTKTEGQLEMSPAERLDHVAKYLTIERVPLPGTNGEHVGQQNGLDPSASEMKRSTSTESDESGGTSGSTKQRKNKQLQTVAKSFGSIGKSISKNLKKMGTLGKNGKDGTDGGKKRVGSATQSTGGGGFTTEMLRDRDHLLCAKLLYKRLEYQDEMVHNYLHNALIRFKCDRELRQQQDAEIKSRQQQQTTTTTTSTSSTTTCVNAGCSGRGSASTAYLCQSCHATQRRQEIQHREPGAGEQYSRDEDPRPLHVNTVNLPPEKYTYRDSTDGKPPGKDANHGSKASALGVVADLPAGISCGVTGRQDTILAAGKSKFYTSVSEDHTPPVSCSNNPSSLNNQANHNVPHQKIYHKAAPLELARSSFYDRPLSVNSGATVINNLGSNAGYSAGGRGGVLDSNKAGYEAANVRVSNVSNNADYRAAAQEAMDSKNAGLRANGHGKGDNNTVYVGKADNTAAGYRSGVASEVSAEDAAAHFSPVSRQAAFKYKDETVERQLSGGSDNKARCYSNGSYTTPNNAAASAVYGKNINNASYGTKSVQREKCRQQQCQFFGSADTDFFCSACYKTRQKALLLQADRERHTML